MKFLRGNKWFRTHQHQGFSLVEVVVGMLIAGLFMATALQVMVVAKVLQARGTELNEAKNWIQQDLELIKAQAATFKSTNLSSSATVGATSLTVDWTTGFASGDIIRIGNDPNDYTVSAASGTTVTISTGLSTAQSAGATISATNMCSATTSATGFAQAIRTSLPGVSPATRTIGGQNFILTRQGFGGSSIPSIRNLAPYQVLEVSYQVTPELGGNPVASLDTEVIADAALKCP